MGPQKTKRERWSMPHFVQSSLVQRRCHCQLLSWKLLMWPFERVLWWCCRPKGIPRDCHGEAPRVSVVWGLSVSAPSVFKPSNVSICDDQLYSNKSYETFTIRTYEYRGEAEIYSKTCKYEWFTCKCETLGVVCRVADAVCESRRVFLFGIRHSFG